MTRDEIILNIRQNTAKLRDMVLKRMTRKDTERNEAETAAACIFADLEDLAWLRGQEEAQRETAEKVAKLCKEYGYDEVLRRLGRE